MKKKHLKPTGKLPTLRISSGDFDIEYLNLPESKGEIELYVMNITVNQLKELKVNPWSVMSDPLQNTEQDFDFTLDTSRGVEYLDLMEIAPRVHFAGSIDNAPGSYNVGTYVDSVLESIRKKASKYGFSNLHSVHLLLYSTDWRIRPTSKALLILAYELSQCEFKFRSIIVTILNSSEDIQVKQISPVGVTISVEQSIQFRNTRVLFADFESAASSDNGVSFRICPSTKT